MRFSSVIGGYLDPPGAAGARISSGQEPRDFSNGIACRAVSEIHVCHSFRPTTASALRPGASSGASIDVSVNRYSREFEFVQPGYALNRPVNKRGPVNGENGEFEGKRQSNPSVPTPGLVMQ